MLKGLFAIAILVICIGCKDNSRANNAYHPFKSPEAKRKYIAFNNKRASNWPVPHDTIMVSTSFGETFVRISGEKEKPPLFLLPGGGANSLSWNKNISGLSKHFCVYAIDNINDFGRSVYSIEIQSADDFTVWLDSFFLDKKLSNIFLFHTIFLRYRIL